MNDSGGLNWYPANDYALSGEWARADFDRRHRLLLLGTLTPAPRLTLGVALTLQSGLPYSETLGGDPYNNGRGNARPAGVAAQQPAGRGQRGPRPAAGARFRVRQGAGGEDAQPRPRRVQPPEPRQLRHLRRHGVVAALRAAGQRRSAARAAALGARSSSEGNPAGSTPQPRKKSRMRRRRAAAHARADDADRCGGFGRGGSEPPPARVSLAKAGSSRRA